VSEISELVLVMLDTDYKKGIWISMKKLMQEPSFFSRLAGYDP